jgi:hypothetical protein
MVAPDGERFLLNAIADEMAPSTTVVVSPESVPGAAR